jgi:membrane protein required for colicin V production
MGSLTALDIVVLVLVLGGAVLGFVRGLVQEVTSLLAWILAILAVRFFHATLTALLADYVGTPGGAAMLAFATVLFMGITLLYDIGYGNAQRPAWMSDSRTYPALSATSAALSKVIADRRAEAREAQTAAAKQDAADGAR